MSVKDFLFKNTTTRQTVLKNSFWMSVGEIGSRLFRSLIIIYAARVLGAEGYGIFSYILGLTGFFTVFADIGISRILTREVAKKVKNVNEYFATILWIKSVLLLITASLIIFVAPYFSKIEGVRMLLVFSAILVVFDSLREFSKAYFRGKEKMELEALITTATNVAITIFGFAILSVWATPKALIITYALSGGTGALLGAYLLRDKLKRAFSAFKKDLIKPILTSAWPLAFMGVLGVFMLRMDIIMLGYFKEAFDVGLYSAGQKIVGVLYTLPAILSTSIFPELSQAVGKNNKKRVGLVMEDGMRAILLLSIPMMVGGVILAEEIMGFLFGAEYLAGADAFRILIITPLIVFPGTIIGGYIFAHDQQKKVPPLIALGAVINVILNVVLIPIWGIVGAGVATLISNTAYFGGSWLVAKKINNFYTLKNIVKIIAGALLMGVVALGMKILEIHVLINIIISAVIYFGFLYTIKEKTIKDLRNILPI